MSAQGEEKMTSPVTEALAGVDEFQKQLVTFLDSVLASLSRNRATAKPWDLDRESFQVISTGIKLEKLLEKVDEHQDVQAKIEETRKAIESKTEHVRSIGLALERGETKLVEEIARAERLLVSESSSSSTERVPLDWIIQLSRKLGFTTKAAPGWHYKQGRPLPGRFHPPAPQVDDMKKSTLFKSPEQLLDAKLAVIPTDQQEVSAADVEWATEEPQQSEPKKENSRKRRRTTKE